LQHATALHINDEGQVVEQTVKGGSINHELGPKALVEHLKKTYASSGESRTVEPARWSEAVPPAA
jgi:hypothetical protein